MDQTLDRNGAGRQARVHDALRVLVMATLIVLVVALLWQAPSVFLIAFTGLLLAVFLRAPANWLAKKTPLKPGWALTLVVIVFAGLVVLCVWLLGERIAGQLDQLFQQLPASLTQLRRWLGQYGWGQYLLEQAGRAGGMLPGLGKLLSGAVASLRAILAVPVNIVLILFFGLYLAAQPRLYESGIVHLVPPSRRGRAAEVLDVIERTLAWWIVARLVSMTAVGVLTWLALWIAGLPLPLTLGFISGALGFIPNLGPVIAAVPAVLLAIPQGTIMVIVVFAIYLVINGLDGYLLTPLLQRKAISLPPVIVLLSQLTFGALFGFFGLLVATPLAAVLMVLVEMLYVHDRLSDPIQPGVVERHGR